MSESGVTEQPPGPSLSSPGLKIRPASRADALPPAVVELPAPPVAELSRMEIVAILAIALVPGIVLVTFGIGFLVEGWDNMVAAGPTSTAGFEFFPRALFLLILTAAMIALQSVFVGLVKAAAARRRDDAWWAENELTADMALFHEFGNDEGREVDDMRMVAGGIQLTYWTLGRRLRSLIASDLQESGVQTGRLIFPDRHFDRPPLAGGRPVLITLHSGPRVIVGFDLLNPASWPRFDDRQEFAPRSPSFHKPGA